MSNSAPPRDAASVIAQEFLVDDPCAIGVDIPGAHTRLRPGPQPDRVEVNVSVTGCPPEEAEDILDRMQVGTQQMKDTVRVYSDGDRSDAVWWRWIRTLDVTIHVDLKLPSNVEANLRVPGGEVDIADLQGVFDINAMGGRCLIQDVSGILTVQGESTDVSVQRFSGNELDVTIAAGSITLEEIEADEISVHSVCAPVRLSEVSGETTLTANGTSVEVEHASGAFTGRVQSGSLSFDAAPTDDVDLRAVGAPIYVTLPADHGADVHIHGETIDLDDTFSFVGEQTEHDIQGTLNDGGPQLSLRAIRGDVSCRAE